MEVRLAVRVVVARIISSYVIMFPNRVFDWSDPDLTGAVIIALLLSLLVLTFLSLPALMVRYCMQRMCVSETYAVLLTMQVLYWVAYLTWRTSVMAGI